MARAADGEGISCRTDGEQREIVRALQEGLACVGREGAAVPPVPCAEVQAGERPWWAWASLGVVLGALAGFLAGVAI